MTVERITVGRWAVNCHLVHDGSVGVIVDPGDEAETIGRHVERLGFEPLAIVNTHAHFDHVGAVAELRRAFDVPFCLHRGDRRLLTHANLYRSLAGDATLIETPVVDRFLEPAEPLQVGSWELDVLHTPGHTAGSVCLRVGTVLISGDTLFSDGVGRTDLPGGSREQLADSLRLLAQQDPGMEIFPGHGPGSRLGDALSRANRTSSDG